ncbi:MAG: triose-phosphate isomerase [Deltaproteobacteria bacterium]
MRRKLIAGNWKMNKGVTEAIALANGLKRELIDIETVDIALCPPFTALDSVNEIITESNLQLGAQDVYWETAGAFTGEISPLMLKDLGCAYGIVGHSERRQFFHETNATVNKKAKALLAAGLTPILCVGESLQERESEKTFDVIRDHVKNGLAGFSAEEMSRTVIAYEPVWAIGTGKTATPAQAQEVHVFIRSLIGHLFDRETADAAIILYGGSVKPDNTADLMKQSDIDGALVGGASLDVASFASIVKTAATLRP